jgi:uncharacterized membrane protein YoaT (DUF817 family)
MAPPLLGKGGMLARFESRAWVYGALRWGVARERAVAAWVEARGTVACGVYEFLRFGVKQAWACLFGALLLGLIIASKIWYPQHAWLARYDALVLAAVVIQAGMLGFRLETLNEAKVILVFHIIGTVMEVFKTSIGAWTYPEPSLLRIGGVPLFTGFMYAAIGSYLTRAWVLLDFRFTRHPPLAALGGLSVAIYVNFFSHHFLPDFRLLLLLVTALLFGRTIIYFRCWRVYRKMPLLLGFGLVAVFIWFAENIGTLMGVWRYPSQLQQWHAVPPEKLEAWFLLMIVSYTLVAVNQGVRGMTDADFEEAK